MFVYLCRCIMISVFRGCSSLLPHISDHRADTMHLIDNAALHSLAPPTCLSLALVWWSLPYRANRRGVGVACRLNSMKPWSSRQNSNNMSQGIITMFMLIDGNLVTLYRSNENYHIFSPLSKCCVNRSCDILKREDGGQRTHQSVYLSVYLSIPSHSLSFVARKTSTNLSHLIKKLC